MRSAEGRAADPTLDVLGALAIAGVTTLCALTPTWPPWAYPAAGLIAAAWGARMAAALDAANHQPLKVAVRHLTRVLPPVWFVAVATLLLIRAQGWPSLPRGAGTSWRWRVLLTWLLPVDEPHVGDVGYHELAGRLWFVRALVWLIVLSPALVFCARRWTRRTAAVVLVLVAATAAGPLGEQDGLGTKIGLSLAVLGGPWLLGVAQHDHRLRAWRLAWVVLAGLGLAAGGAWYFVASPARWQVDQSGSPRGLGACAALALGVTLLLLRLTPPLTGLTGWRLPARVVGVLDERMLTLYMWSGTCGYLAGLLPRRPWADGLGWARYAWVGAQVGVTWAGVVAAVLLLGWVEDLGADGVRGR